MYLPDVLGLQGNCIVLAGGVHALAFFRAGDVQPVERGNVIDCQVPGHGPGQGIARMADHLANLITIRQAAMAIAGLEFHGDRIDVRAVSSEPADGLVEGLAECHTLVGLVTFSDHIGEARVSQILRCGLTLGGGCSRSVHCSKAIRHNRANGKGSVAPV